MDLANLSLKQLREMAKEKGLSGVSALRKGDLVHELEKLIVSETPAKDASQTEKKEIKRSRTVNKREENRENRESGRDNNRENKKKPVYTYVPNHGERSHNRNGAARQDARSERRYDSRQDGNYDGGQGNRQDTRPERRYDNRQDGNYDGGQGNRQDMRQQDAHTENQPFRTIEDVVRAGLITIAKDRQVSDVHPTEIRELDSGITKKGILEIMSEGYGFIRCDNFLPGENDVYVSPAFLRRFGLRTGDIVEGNIRVRTQNEKFSALLYMKSVNGQPITYLAHRSKFEDLTPIFPNERIHLETAGSGVSMRMLDLIAPIGKGQRGMIVAQPKTGKTTLLKQVAGAITKNYPKMHLLILLIDERPEEVTDIKESIEGEQVEVIYSTFDELPENHKRVSEMVIERAKRLVEGGGDVVILLDSITRLARAYNLTVTPSGRTLSGGLDPAALHMPKRFFGAARNMREGGSLTILATALVDTGSRMDDVVFEEFKGTGNMELVLDRHLSEKRVFPAIDIQKSSTRREDLLLNQSELEAVYLMRKALSATANTENNLEQIINLFRKTKNNREFIETIKKIKLH